MQNFIFILLAIPFLWINYLIVKTDLKIKKIPNKYLLYLIYVIPLYYIYIFYYFDINILFFLLQILLTLVISFILYYFGIWSAGDAKYLLILGLFIPHIGIFPFIGNIALITISYLLLFFLWFYFGKGLFNWKYTKSLYSNIYIDLKDKFINFSKNGDGKIYKKNIALKIFKWLITFLIFFISIRISRIYIFNNIFENEEKSKLFLDILEKYHIYIFISFIIIFIGLMYIIKFLYGKLKDYLVKKNNIKLDYIDLFFLSILFIILSSFLIYEYILDSESLFKNLYIIFTFYLAIFIIIIIIIYSYKISFQISESNYIDISDLKEGDIIDKEYLLNIFSKQKYLINKYKFLMNKNKNIESIKKPIDKKTLSKLKIIYKIVNDYEYSKDKNHKNIKNIKILKTFSFGIYIFGGFLLNYIFGGFLLNLIIKFIIYKIIII